MKPKLFWNTYLWSRQHMPLLGNNQKTNIMKVQLIFRWYDLWIGFFWDSKKHWLYFFPIPMVGVILKFTVKWKPNKCNHKWIKIDYPVDMGIQRCIKCNMYIGGTDPYTDEEHGDFEWLNKDERVKWTPNKDGVLTRIYDNR